MKNQENVSSERLNQVVRMPESAVQDECESCPVEPEITCGYVVIKTPVILAEVEIQFVTDAIITFPEPVLEIKSVRKQVKISHSRLLLPSDKIFLKGIVRKNIQYATPIGANNKMISSNLRSLTVDIPFSYTTEITDYLSKPIYKYNEKLELNFYKQNAIHELNHCEDDSVCSDDVFQFDEVNKEIFNEKIYCEVMTGRIIEYNEPLNREYGNICGGNQEQQYENVSLEEGTFTALENKMVIDLKMKVLQQQQIRVESKGF
ncbi:DUF3794 domain-containing protein [Bacillus toyonensis]|uniref:CsxC family protein n=1 Tax=Bacillus toyonensis TaxID=155322 RepID=UPI000BFD441D|nr:DUF3794 domain-containing protein [Bacillus toyonensis]PHE90198.1 DUF3794 domain-containing protein [Bacillus toyonensis]